MPCRVNAEEIELASSVIEASSECADIAQSKEECLIKGGDCSELMKSFMECAEAHEKENR